MSGSPTVRPGDPVALLLRLAFGCVFVLTAACASEPRPEPRPTSSDFGPPVVREGVVYTPASVGPRGCVLYRLSVPGGQAPAALMYRSEDGEFTYHRPARCVSSAAFGATR